MDSDRYRFRRVLPVPRLLLVRVPDLQAWERLKITQTGARRRGRVGRAVFVMVVLLGVVVLGLSWFEARTSHFQSRYFAGYAASIGSAVGDGASDAFGVADGGPLDQRMGYVRLPEMVEGLQKRGFRVERQARWSALMMKAQQQGLFVIYPRKVRGGLRLRGAYDDLVYGFSYPQRHYEGFEDIPELLVETLLFIEDRDVLNGDHQRQNPAVAPVRLMRAVLDKVLSLLGSRRDVAGGSTLATQMEKFNHSASGRTESVSEKMRQMMSASLRAYLGGPLTIESRRLIVRDYVNSVPLGARKGWGEVHGVGDGLSVWFGVDFGELNAVLKGGVPEQGDAFWGYARAYRVVLMLLLAQQRPSSYLPGNVEALHERTDLYLKLLGAEGVISERLRDAALAERIEISDQVPFKQVQGQLAENLKTLKTWQIYLGKLLGVQSLYALERMDVSARTTLDLDAQRAVEAVLAKLADPAEVQRRGLNERKRVGYGKADEIIYSVYLVERGLDHIDRVRVQTDTLADALDMNHGSKLDLGSTAKLRVLVHYLEIIEALYEDLAGLSADDLLAYEVRSNDVLTRWVRNYLRRRPGISVRKTLQSAMERTYSADPGASFMTGGGEHRFGNVVENDEDEEEADLFLSVSAAFRVSANLPFVRIMRDIINYHIARLSDERAAILDDVDDPRRSDYLDRFAGRDARKYVRRFYDRYAGLDAEEMRKTLNQGARWSQSEREFVAAFLAGRAQASSDGYRRRHEEAPNPIELFVVRYLLAQPEATLTEVMRASGQVRERSKAWILWPEREVLQKRRIRYGLEEEAFEEVLAAWRRVGFPFDRMIPSYASALGASADRPSALAKLVGIIQAGGVRRPVVRIEGVQFAENTPYETHLGLMPVLENERVMSAEVAEVLRDALLEVADRGTGRHGKWDFRDENGDILPVRGKTGTGDNRHKLYNRRGRVVGYRTTNRTATWAFMIGECFYGTIVAYVPGEVARGHTFMSELSVMVLAELKVALEGLVAGVGDCVGDDD